jgi:hypothetical protein
MKDETTATTGSHPIERVLDSLDNVYSTSRYQYRAKCPVHQKANSRSRTLSIKEETDGHVLLNCFAGCDYAEVLDAIGLKKCDLYPNDGFIANWAYERELGKRTPRDIINDCKPSATLVQVYVGHILKPKNWKVLSETLDLDDKDLWVLQGASECLRELLDA